MEYLCVKCRRLAETEQCPWCGSRETKEAEGSDYCYLSEWGGEEAGALADLLNLNSIPFQTRKNPCDTKRTYYSFFVPYRSLEDAKDTILTQLSGSRAAAEGARDDSGPFDGDEVDRMEMVELDGMSLDELREQVQDIAGFHSLKDAAAERARFDIMSMLLNVIIVTLLILAAVMVYFILMNLTMTYIQRKTRELTVMRINGFTTRECIVYAAWDLLVTTVVGIAVGLAVGNRIGSWIARMLEGPYAQFVREPDLRTFVFSALITLVFSLIVNGYALGKIRNLKLADINS